MQKETGNWYASWFCTPYYHILYRDRDVEEAGYFMNNLVDYLELPESAHILDLACGRGRHAIHLNNLGYQVTGVDLSESNIAIASELENNDLKFFVHDMREPFGSKFDAVFNLFTSFGYFENASDNLKAVKAIKANLDNKGFGVIDFLNIEYIRDHLVPEETKEVDGILFNIKRKITDGFIVKEIRFNADGAQHFFEERVQAISLQDFERYFKSVGVEVIDCLGTYDMKPFDNALSERLILIFN